MTTETAIKTDKGIPCKLHYKAIRASADLPALSEAFARLESASILGGNAAKANDGGFSYWAAEPKEVFEFRAGQKDPFGRLQEALAKYIIEDHQGNHTGLPLRGMFCGGWVGYFSYELGRYIEKLPDTAIDDVGTPLIRLCFYDRLIAFDHIEKTFWLIALELPGDWKRRKINLTPWSCCSLNLDGFAFHGLHPPTSTTLISREFDATWTRPVTCGQSKK